MESSEDLLERAKDLIALFSHWELVEAGNPFIFSNLNPWKTCVMIFEVFTRKYL